MSVERKLSSSDLERLLLRRRREEVVERLRSLAPLPADEEGGSVVQPISSTGLVRPQTPPPPAKRIRSPRPWPPLPDSANPPHAGEVWLRPASVRLEPAALRKRQRQPRALPTFLSGVRRAAGRVVDILIVLVLVLFVLASGFWVYETYIEPMLRGTDHPTVRPVRSWSVGLGQGRLSSPEEAAAQAPLPFLPYSSTLELEAPYVPVPTPAPGNEMPTRLLIPRIQLDTPVVEVTIEAGVWQVAQYAVGYHRGTARPGTVGNTVMSGHKGVYGAPFRRLDELSPGDEILVVAGTRLYRYVVREKTSVWPHQVEVMAQTADPILTLITCTAYDTRRLVVIAQLDREISTDAGP